MILNPDVASLLDKAAENVSEVAVMPTALSTCGRESGDPGFDALSAVAFAMIDLDFMDKIEMQFGHPHLAEIMHVVADFGAVPECDRERQNERFEVGGYRMNAITDRMRRTDDVIMWGRGLATSEVAQLYRWAADEFRSRPADQGVYPLDGSHEIAEARAEQAFLKGVRAIAAAKAHESPEMAQMLGMVAQSAMFGMIDNVFVNDVTPDPDMAVLVRRTDVTPVRIAEIVQGVIDLINELGWTDTYLFNPQTGAVSIRGALALVVGLPPRMDYLTSKIHMTERRWAEFWQVDTVIADLLGLPIEPCPGCGKNHADERLAPWENGGRTQDEVISVLNRVRDAQVAVATHDAGFGADLESVDWDAFARQLSGGGAGS